jgi:integrase
MASVDRRDRNGKVTWSVRWRDGTRQKRKTFRTQREAKDYAATVVTDKARGSYVDPQAGRVTLAQYSSEWLEGQTFDAATRVATELRLRVHVAPHLGSHQLHALRPSMIQAWLRTLQLTLAPSYVRVIFSNLSAVLSAAVDDSIIAKNPCRASSIKLPGLDSTLVHPWAPEQVRAVAEALPDRFRMMVVLGAGCGLRQGEIFGLAVDDVDFLRGVLHVRRQVKILDSRQVFALPKGRKVRDVPLPDSVGLELAQHLSAFPATNVELPWGTLTGAAHSAGLVLTTRERSALNRNYINTKIWKPALVEAGIEPTRSNGMHVLRHTFASVLLDAGESVRALADYLGHRDPGFTLRTYTHLMPSSEDRTKRAVDTALGGSWAASNGPFGAPTVPRATADTA